MSELFAAAWQARAFAYAPYSGFAVGAAILAASGRIYAGCNVENAAYPEGLCAEASAIGACIAGGDTQVLAVVVAADSRTPVAPCGACRQRLREFAASDMKIHAADGSGIVATWTLAELLPHAFGPENLLPPLRRQQEKTQDK